MMGRWMSVFTFHYGGDVTDAFMNLGAELIRLEP